VKVTVLASDAVLLPGLHDIPTLGLGVLPWGERPLTQRETVLRAPFKRLASLNAATPCLSALGLLSRYNVHAPEIVCVGGLASAYSQLARGLPISSQVPENLGDVSFDMPAITAFTTRPANAKIDKYMQQDTFLKKVGFKGSAVRATKALHYLSTICSLLLFLPHDGALRLRTRKRASHCFPPQVTIEAPKKSQYTDDLLGRHQTHTTVAAHSHKGNQRDKPKDDLSMSACVAQAAFSK